MAKASSSSWTLVSGGGSIDLLLPSLSDSCSVVPGIEDFVCCMEWFDRCAVCRLIVEMHWIGICSLLEYYRYMPTDDRPDVYTEYSVESSSRLLGIIETSFDVNPTNRLTWLINCSIVDHLPTYFSDNGICLTARTFYITILMPMSLFAHSWLTDPDPDMRKSVQLDRTKYRIHPCTVPNSMVICEIPR